MSKEPLEVNSKAVATMIKAIAGLKRKALDVTELLKDFGPDSEVAQIAIKTLYNKLDKCKSLRTHTLFSDWKRVSLRFVLIVLTKLRVLRTDMDLDTARQTLRNFCLLSIPTMRFL